MSIPFCKFHGFGNDYIVIEQSNIPADTDVSELARQMCHRHTGAGADGIAVLIQSGTADADFICKIINPDGSEAGFSGNGTRCAAAYLYYEGLWAEPALRLKTISGIKSFDLKQTISPGRYVFEAEIGMPAFAPGQVPVRSTSKDAVIDEPVTIDGNIYRFSAVNVGNPVAAVFVEDFDLDWRSVGRVMETHEVFPERCNIVFVKVVDSETLDIRIWERGAGETSASGTCAAGAAVLSAYTQRTIRHVNVHSPGGVSRIDWRDDDEMVLTGQADLAYCGEWPVS